MPAPTGRMTHASLRLLKLAGEQGHTAADASLVARLQRVSKLTWQKHELHPLYEEGDLIFLDGSPPLFASASGLVGEARIATWEARCRAFGSPPTLPLGPPPEARYSASQCVAWAGLSRRGVGILNGGPGTGKTFLIGEMIEKLIASNKIVEVCAPTGKAASVLASKLRGMVQPCTIHRLLGLIPGQSPAYNSYRKLDLDVLFVDECSMIDASLMGYLVDALRPETNVIFVGDVDQLLPVGAGAPFRDFIYSGWLPLFTLTEVQRQATGNGIIDLVGEIRQGRGLNGRSFPNVHVHRYPKGEIEARVVDCYTSGYLADKFRLTDIPRQCLIITPMKQAKLDSSTEKLNEIISHHLLPERTLGKSKFTRGDRVMFTVNDYKQGFVNGEVGTLEDYKRSARQAIIRNDQGRIYELEDYDLHKYVDWFYAGTIHKSQGSESPVVIMVLDPRHAFAITRNLLYTGASRAKDDLILIGDPALVDEGVRRVETRITALARLRGKEDLCKKIIARATVPDLSDLVDLVEEYF